MEIVLNTAENQTQTTETTTSLRKRLHWTRIIHIFSQQIMENSMSLEEKLSLEIISRICSKKSKIFKRLLLSLVSADFKSIISLEFDDDIFLFCLIKVVVQIRPILSSKDSSPVVRVFLLKVLVDVRIFLPYALKILFIILSSNELCL